MLDLVPSETLKPRVRERLTQTDVIRRFDAKIKKGMCVAIGVLRGESMDESVITRPKFAETGLEADALQIIFDQAFD
jgi:hypothetical protein